MLWCMPIDDDDIMLNLIKGCDPTRPMEGMSKRPCTKTKGASIVGKIQMPLNVNVMWKHENWPDLLVIAVHFLFLIHSLTGVVHPDTGSTRDNDSTIVGVVGISSFSPSCIDLAGGKIALQGTKVGTFIGILALLLLHLSLFVVAGKPQRQ